MGKKNKHSKDKLHKTVAELKSHHVGSNRDLELSILHRRLRFDSCCLSLNTISDKPIGICDGTGYCYVFECDLILKFIEKFKVHPITGSEINSSQLIELKFHKNEENQYHCPVNFKQFNQHSKIIANKKTGNVYSFEAYQQLNLKENNFRDLLTDEPFNKDVDIVFLQDPDKADEKWKVTDFYYVKNKLKLDDDEDGINIRNTEHSEILKASLEEYKQKEDAIVDTFKKIVGNTSDVKKDSVRLDKINSATYSDGVLAKSVTSTVMPITSNQSAALLNEEEILYPRIKKKGYLQIMTNFGPLNLELFCDRTPKTCHNFLLLAARGYYENTCFHRLIKNFILQGGDPTGTGSGGQSAWGSPFKDECFGDLKHIGRGVLAMANSGPNSNKSQFYITLRGVWDHLDGKHTVFGRIVGGDETLNKIESVECDKNDKPKKEIKILQITIYVDPFKEVEHLLQEERKKSSSDKSNLVGKTKSISQQPLKKFRSGVGAYIDLEQVSNKKVKIEKQSTSEANTVKNGSTLYTSLGNKLASLRNVSQTSKTFNDFSNW